jgi:crotonobetaine/carnitine-CoA ligase
LQAAGIGTGDRVAIICSNRIELLGLLIGCGWLGAVAVPINVASRGAQLQHILANSGARLLVMEPEFADNLAMLDAGALALEAIWTIGEPGEFHFGRIAPRAMPLPGKAAPPPVPGPSDLAMILYTSGTTGPRRASAVRTHNISGGASTPPRCSASRLTTSSAPACRCSTPTRSTRFIRRC